jgi:outer membrane biogenesis lipoprotein LolB
MKNIHRSAVAALATLMLTGCGGSDNPNQPSADERKALDDIARKQDQEQKDQTFDTSADSLVPSEGAVQPADEANAAVANSPAAVDAAGNSTNVAAPQ